MLGSFSLNAAPKQGDLDERGLLDFLSGAKKSNDVVLNLNDSIVIEDLEDAATKCGDWDDWGYCPKRRIKAFEVCAHNMYTDKLTAHHARIKELCSKKAKIDKLWSDMIATDALFAEKAKIDKLWAGQACAYKLCAHKGNIKELVSDLIYTDSLKAEWADLDHINAETICTHKICTGEAHALKLCSEEAVIKHLKATENVELETQYRICF